MILICVVLECCNVLKQKYYFSEFNRCFQTCVIFTGLFSSLLAPVYDTVLEVYAVLTKAENVKVVTVNYVCIHKYVVMNSVGRCER